MNWGEARRVANDRKHITHIVFIFGHYHLVIRKMQGISLSSLTDMPIFLKITGADRFLKMADVQMTDADFLLTVIYQNMAYQK